MQDLEHFERLLVILEELGWTIAIPSINEDKDVPGVIIGTDKYVETVTNCLPEDLFKDWE